MEIVEMTGTCTAGGALTLTSTQTVNGRLEKIIYDYQDGDTGSDFTITCEGPVSQPILTVTDAGVADLTWYPRTPANAVADAAAFTNWAEKIYVTGTFKVVVAQGGNAKDFRFLFYVSDE